MAVDQENVSKILSVLSHPLRREILQYLSEKEEGSFTDLMNALNIDTGKLSFHIRNLAAFLEQTPTGKYKLSKTGQNAIVLIKDLEAWAIETELAKRTSTLPLASFRRRAYAYLIDFALAFTLFLALPTAISYVAGRFFSLDISLILFLILFWASMTLLEGFAGQSLGKRVVGLKVVRTDGKSLFYDHVAVRNFGKFLFLLPFDLIIGHRLKDKRYMRYFDKFSGTTVIDIRPPSSSSNSAKPTDSAKSD